MQGISTGAVPALLVSVLVLAACSTPQEEPLAEMLMPEPEIEIPVIVLPITPACAMGGDALAIRVAALQQRLMVAAYVCHEAASYNEFVLAYRGDLQNSDHELQGFFNRTHGRTGNRAYDTFKTQLANTSMLESADNLDTYCAASGETFSAAMGMPEKSLRMFVSTIVVPADDVLACDMVAVNAADGALALEMHAPQ